MGKLALTVELQEGETAFSFMSRLAAHNGLEAQIFSNDMGVAFKSVIDADYATLEHVSAISGTEIDKLLAYTPRYHGKRLHEYRGYSFHAKGIKLSTVKGCPVCLADDLKDGAESMYLRGHWMPLHATICPIHQHPLVPLWGDTSPVHRYDTLPYFQKIISRIRNGSLEQQKRAPTPFEFWFLGRLSNTEASDWLNNFDLYAACRFCDLLGRVTLRKEMPYRQLVAPENLWRRCDAGFHIANQGEEAIQASFMKLQSDDDAPRKGFRKTFGDLYDRLSFDLTGDEYRPFRELLRSHIVQTWPLGPGDDLMGEPITKRSVHSVLTAAQETGIDTRRMRKLLSEHGIVAPIGEGKPDSWELFDAHKAKDFLASLDHHVSAIGLQKALNISRSQFELLRSDGWFPPDLQGPDHKPLWNLIEARRRLEMLMNGALPVSGTGQFWETVSKAAQRLKTRPAAILNLIETKSISRIGKLGDTPGYAGIVVDITELRLHFEPDEMPGINIEAFAKTVGLRPIQAGRLVRNNFTASTKTVNPVTKLQQQVLSPEDIANFHNTYITLKGLSVELQRSWQSLIPDIEGHGIKAFSPDGVDYGPLFLRDEITTLINRS